METFRFSSCISCLKTIYRATDSVEVEMKRRYRTLIDRQQHEKQVQEIIRGDPSEYMPIFETDKSQETY
jgi:hypothetical protein